MFGGRVARVDDSAAKKVPGVHKVVVFDDLVAVVGDHMWAAKQGLDALVIEWDEGANANLSSHDIWEALRTQSEKDGVVAKSVGDIAKGQSQGDRYDAAYELPFLAHATMEPMACTARVDGDRAELWVGTQDPLNARATAASALEIDAERITVHNMLLGGGFGRKLPYSLDFVAMSARIARAQRSNARRASP